MRKRDRFEGLGVTARELEPDTPVMVAVGRVNAIVNGGPCTIAWAVVRGKADEDPASTTYWLDVYAAAGSPPMPQMYRAEEILGVPAFGLRMDGAPEPPFQWPVTAEP